VEGEDSMTEDEEREWQERLRAAVEATLRKRASRARFRAERTEARRYGKAAYHAAKLARAQALIDAKVEAGELERLPNGMIRKVEP
jgi:hypothetical protein